VLGFEPVALGPLDESEEEVPVPVADRLSLAALFQLLPGVLPYRLQQPIAGAPLLAFLEDGQVLVH
jgi:hypothetical protein